MIKGFPRPALLTLLGFACSGEPPPISGDAPPPEEIVGCAKPADCPFGEVCENGECTRPDTMMEDSGCTSDDECGAGQGCALATGKCLPLPSEPEHEQETPPCI
ncbi:MAG: hypothetical protein HYZ27_00395, partial [Deltaproteobacteria bacterium]|nr:hypothetical protein [Deltaproteobacteria bacterium]